MGFLLAIRSNKEQLTGGVVHGGVLDLPQGCNPPPFPQSGIVGSVWLLQAVAYAQGPGIRQQVGD